MRSIFSWSLVAVLSLVGIAAAQPRAQTQPRVQPRSGARPAAGAPAANAPQPGQHGQQGTADQQIAAKLWGCNHNEAELAKFAQQHAKSDSVKEFAAQMIKDHSQQADKLARVAGKLASAGEGDTRREARKVPSDEEEQREEGRRENRDEGTRGEGREEREEGGREKVREDRRDTRDDRRDDRASEGQPRAGGQQHGQQGPNWVAINKEIAQQCLTSTKKELGQYEGEDFDKAYIGMQIAAHMMMVDELKVFRNHVSSELQGDLDTALKATQHHLQEAKKIMDEQKGKSSSSPDRNSNDDDDDK